MRSHEEQRKNTESGEQTKREVGAIAVRFYSVYNNYFINSVLRKQLEGCFTENKSKQLAT